MENSLKEALKGKQVNKLKSNVCGGDISETAVYEVDRKKVFVKTNSDSGARRMFEGEFCGLKAIGETQAVRVPTPYVIFEHEGSSCLAMEFLKLNPLNNKQAELGRQLAHMHLHNTRHQGGDDVISKFGFHTTTSCGSGELDNTWNDDWVDFYVRQRIQPQIERTRDQQAQQLWSDVTNGDCMSSLFPPSLQIEPCLVHGDLWSGNCGEDEQFCYLFDPAVFYAHHEFDLAIARIFGGFGSSFFDAYHDVIAKQDGMEARGMLYDLFHYLNHWNHFGGANGYRSASIRLLRRLACL